jgi:hypothetical protein
MVRESLGVHSGRREWRLNRSIIGGIDGPLPRTSGT